MKRSVYSLVLMDDVVRQIDKVAYSMNTSRSNLINQILAEYVCCPTPEQRTKDVFEQITQLMLGNDGFQIQQQPSDALLSLRSALRFKYNPTIRYVWSYTGDMTKCLANFGFPPVPRAVSCSGIWKISLPDLLIWSWNAGRQTEWL